ncbi:hypothetical protein [Staphylococcus epidermidis]|uniref:hypothetical protein n=1 Tax=Staphylococcus epidermidis TaxID=1282 RepID=UPI00254EB277|nr:hypothetical protein [Staphylococcus epidermidis]MDK7902811.1 hypothetical protein [Staphylococcus epidermidis]MDK8779931.1 hypothetical protein [Staphylococcus epidermidis]
MKFIKNHFIISVLIGYIIIISLILILNHHFKIINTDFYNILKTTTPIFIAFLVYLYTTDNHKRQLLNELDSKSEWRKKLFDIAGTQNIKKSHVFELRAALRFDEKNKNDSKDLFDKMNIIIIKYCKQLTKEDNYVYLKNYDMTNTNNTLNLCEQETIRLFCRYLLADHWEKNQRRDFTTPKRKNKELCKYTLIQFIHLNSDIKDCKTKKYNNKCLKCLFKKANCIINTLK